MSMEKYPDDMRRRMEETVRNIPPDVLARARASVMQSGPCKTCDHHGTLETDGRCLWCHGRERKAAKARGQLT